MPGATPAGPGDLFILIALGVDQKGIKIHNTSHNLVTVCSKHITNKTTEEQEILTQTPECY